MSADADVDHFRCTACGKCCDAPPELLVSEAFDLGDCFVPWLIVKLNRVPQSGNEVGLSQIRRDPAFGDMEPLAYIEGATQSVMLRHAIRLAGEPGFDGYLTITARPWVRSPSCPALDAEGRCSIHARRPHTCRTIPVSYDVPDAIVSRAYRYLIRQGQAHRAYACDTSNEAPALFRGNQLVDEEYVAARAAAQQAAEADSALVRAILQSAYVPPLQSLVSTVYKQGSVALSFHGALIVAHETGAIDDTKMRTFAAGQVKLLEAEIEAAIRRKDKRDRDHTERNRSLLDVYRTVIDRLSTKAATA